MSRITTPATIDASPTAARPLLEAVQRQLGSVPNLFRLLGTSPAALEGYLGLSGALGKGALEPQTRTRIALVVAELNGCGYCLAAHTYLGTHVAKLDAAELAANRDASSSDAKAEAALRFAAQLVRGRGHVEAADVAAVQAAGHGDAAIVEIILHVAVNTLTNYVNTALATEVDFPEVPPRAAYAEQCAVAISMGERVAADATSATHVDGRLYRFSSPEAKAMFDASPAAFIGKADATWARLRMIAARGPDLALPSDVAFTAAVKAIQTREGSRAAYARMEQGDGWETTITPDVAAFIAAQDSFVLASASAAGQPYVQHRGGPPGFLRILGPSTLGFADYRGNRQYITVGNLTENPRVQLLLVDYAHRRRVKIWGQAVVVEDDAALLARLHEPGAEGRPERAVIIEVTAWDANCPQHIPQRLDAAAVAAVIAERDQTIARLEAQLLEAR